MRLAEKKTINSEQKSRGSFLASMMRTAFLVALLVFVLINIVFRSSVLGSSAYSDPRSTIEALEKKQDGSKKASNPWSFWIAKSYFDCKAAPAVVIFGSSQMGSAAATVDAQHLLQLIDVVTHRKITFLEDELKKRLSCSLEVLSLAVPGSMVSDGYMVSRALFNGANKPKLIVISIAPRDFIDSTLPFPASTEQFKYFSRFVDIANLESSAYTDPFARLDFKVSRLPLRLLGMELLTAAKEKPVSSNPKASDVLSSVTAVASDVSPGQWIVPANIPPIWVDNSKEYITRFKNPNSATYKAEMVFFSEWLQYLRARGIDVMVVGMPSLPMNRQLLPDSFWSKFRTDIARVCEKNRVHWLDLTDRKDFEKSDYLDTVHLNAHGGFKFFRLLANEVAGREEMASCLQAPKPLAANMDKKLPQ